MVWPRGLKRKVKFDRLLTCLSGLFKHFPLRFSEHKYRMLAVKLTLGMVLPCLCHVMSCATHHGCHLG
jgi:hypothetical protein